MVPDKGVLTVIMYSLVVNYWVILLKEVDVGLAADVGTLQRLPKVVGNNR